MKPEESTNVYADLGYSDAEEMQRKSSLVAEISQAIETSQLTQEAAADLLGISQGQISEIIRGRFREVSEAKLLGLVAHLRIARSEAAGDGIPAEQVLARLEAKIAAEQKRRKLPEA